MKTIIICDVCIGKSIFAIISSCKKAFGPFHVKSNCFVD